MLAKYAADDIIAEANLIIMNLKQPKGQCAVEYTQALWTKTLRYTTVYDKSRLEGTFIAGLRQSILECILSYRAKNQSAPLQELAHHALSLVNLQCSSATPESGHSRPEQPNAHYCNTCNTMNVEGPSSIEGPVDCINDRTLMFQQELVISKRMVAVTDQLSTDLTSITAMYQFHYCRICLDQSHTTSKCPHISNTETFIGAQNRNLDGKPSGHTNE